MKVPLSLHACPELMTPAITLARVSIKRKWSRVTTRRIHENAMSQKTSQWKFKFSLYSWYLLCVCDYGFGRQLLQRCGHTDGIIRPLQVHKTRLLVQADPVAVHPVLRRQSIVNQGRQISVKV